MWKQFLDRHNRTLAKMLAVGIANNWETCGDIKEQDRPRCFEAASALLERYEVMLDKPVTTTTIVWRFGYIARDDVLKAEYETNLAASRHFELAGDLARWAPPTFAQFCFGAELLRRRMRSDVAKEEARSAGQLASYRLGDISTGRMLKR